MAMVLADGGLPQADQAQVDRVGFVVLLLSKERVGQAVDGRNQVGVGFAVQRLANHERVPEGGLRQIVGARHGVVFAQMVQVRDEGGVERTAQFGADGQWRR